jgi:hypothetical protein
VGAVLALITALVLFFLLAAIGVWTNGIVSLGHFEFYIARMLIFELVFAYWLQCAVFELI